MNYVDIDPANYISTDNMLQNCEGVTYYDGTPNVDSIMEYKTGDILVSNIRPYLQKIWFADRDGGCSPDVLVIHVIDESKYLPKYVYYALRRKPFFDHMMSGKSGVKMPRGNKTNNLRFSIPNIPVSEQRRVVSEVEQYEKIITDAKATMDDCIKKKQSIVNEMVLIGVN